MVDQEGYGQYLTAKKLNEKGIKRNKEKARASNSVRVVLKNPMYKGDMIYARGTQKQVVSKERNIELAIIDEGKWGRVQAIQEKRNPENNKSKELNVWSEIRRIHYY
ncbi:Recombinase [compost metagenome]